MSLFVGSRFPAQSSLWPSLALASVPVIYFGLIHRSYAVSAVYRQQQKLVPRKTPAPYAAHKFLRGARDVDTPYGSMRVYEFGDAEADRRVLFVPGVSTPCISLASIANILVSNGCRVMLMDLFGRGYSEGPDPEQVRYDSRLYTAQIMCALTSSEIAWTGQGKGFTLVGFSLGGGLAADFASYFPKLVDDLVLIAPGGLQRRHHVSLRSKILYSRGWLPESLLRWLVKRRMTNSGNSEAQRPSPDGETDPMELVEPETASGAASKAASTPTSADGAAACDWQLQHHPGFIPAFMSSLRYAPIQDQHARWALIGKRLDAQRRQRHQHGPTTEAQQQILRSGLRSGQVLLLLGQDDSVVITEEVREDAQAALGGDNVRVVSVAGAGHELPITHGSVCAQHMLELWGKEESL